MKLNSTTKYQHIAQQLAKVAPTLNDVSTHLSNNNPVAAVTELRDARDWLNWAIVETQRQAGTYKPKTAQSGLPVALRDGLDDFSVQILEVKAVLFAALVSDDVPEQALNLLSGGERLTKKLEKDFDALHRAIIDATTTYTPAPAGTEAQALLELLLNMLKMWRRDEISGNEFEEWLEQCVSLASSLVLNPVTEFKGGAV